MCEDGSHCFNHVFDPITPPSIPTLFILEREAKMIEDGPTTSNPSPVLATPWRAETREASEPSTFWMATHLLHNWP
eukprot:TCALIF_12974-PA protein Name:"Protein of unknown function" AED:0.33 eAED:0.40 QI:0/0/0.33/1/0/0/3/1801/75